MLGLPGFGRPHFYMVFRKAYEPERARVDLAFVRKGILASQRKLEQALMRERDRDSKYKGETAEYRMRLKIAMAGQKRLCLGDIVHSVKPLP